MKFATFLVPAALFAIAAPASASVMSLGSNSARLCYLAAEARSTPGQTTLGYCDDALLHDNLNGHDTVATLVNRGILRLRSGKIDAAIDDFDQAIARDPDEAEAYLNKGMASLRLETGWENAVGLFDTAIAKQTRRPELAYYGRAVAHELGGRVKEAYRDYKQASMLDPDWSEPKVDLARFSVRSR